MNLQKPVKVIFYSIMFSFLVFCVLFSNKLSLDKYSRQSALQEGVLEETFADIGDYDPIDLSKFQFSSKGGSNVEPSNNTTLYSDGIFLLHSAEVRFSKLLYRLRIEGECVGENLLISFCFDDSTRVYSTELEKVIGNTEYLLSVEKPAYFQSVRVVGIQVIPATFSITEPLAFGSNKVRLRGANTMDYGESCNILVYDKYGCVLQYLELSGRGSVAIPLGADYLRLLY